MTQICLSCGLCCDGTLFGATDIDQDDARVALEQSHAIFLTDGSVVRAQQPCPALYQGSCSIYEQRPSVCRSFECALLIQVTNGRTSEQEALDIIAATKALRDNTRRQLESVLAPPDLSALQVALGEIKVQEHHDAHRAAQPIAAMVASVGDRLADTENDSTLANQTHRYREALDTADGLLAMTTQHFAIANGEVPASTENSLTDAGTV